MSVRETIDENPGVAIGVSVAVVLIALLISLWSLGVIGSGEVATEDGEVFISEDYTTYRPGTYRERLELGSNGEPKAIAYVLQIGDDEPIVHYFERLSPGALTALNKLPADGGGDTGIQREMIHARGAEVKRPADLKWVPANSSEASLITLPPDVADEITMVHP